MRFLIQEVTVNAVQVSRNPERVGLSYVLHALAELFPPQLPASHAHSVHLIVDLAEVHRRVRASLDMLNQQPLEAPCLASNVQHLITLQ